MLNDDAQFVFFLKLRKLNEIHTIEYIWLLSSSVSSCEIHISLLAREVSTVIVYCCTNSRFIAAWRIDVCRLAIKSSQKIYRPILRQLVVYTVQKLLLIPLFDFRKCPTTAMNSFCRLEVIPSGSPAITNEPPNASKTATSEYENTNRKHC